MASSWSLRLHLEGVHSLNEDERNEVYKALKGYDRADRRELFFKMDAATLKDLGVLDPILRQAILTSVGSTGTGTQWTAVGVARLAQQAGAAGAERVLKRLKGSTSLCIQSGKDLVKAAQTNMAFFEQRLAGYKDDALRALLATVKGAKLRQDWPLAQSEEDVQALVNELFPALLAERPDGKRGTYFDTHLSGLMGHGLRIDATVADRDVRAAPHVATFAELKKLLNNLHEYQAAVGDLVKRVDQLHTSQPDRQDYMAAVIGRDSMQLWWIPAAAALLAAVGVAQPICTLLLPLEMSPESVGLQWLYRWLTSDWMVHGFVAPQLPPAVMLRPECKLSFTSKLVARALGSSVSDVVISNSYRDRPPVLVFTAELQRRPAGAGYAHADAAAVEKLVVKVPGTDELSEKEAANLRQVQGIAGVSCVQLVAECLVTIGSVARRALVLRPRAEHIPLEIRQQPERLLRYVRSLVNMLDKLHMAHLVHCDLSYYNLLYLADGQPLLADLQTLTPVLEADGTGPATGTPLFMALDVMRGNGHRLSTDLESVMYVIIYVLCGGWLPWHNLPTYQGLTARNTRAGAMTVQFELEVLSRVPPQAERWLLSLRNTFFPLNSYRTDVDSKAFLDACYV